MHFKFCFYSISTVFSIISPVLLTLSESLTKLIIHISVANEIIYDSRLIVDCKTQGIKLLEEPHWTGRQE